MDICGSGPRSLPVLLYWQDAEAAEPSPEAAEAVEAGEESDAEAETTTAEAREGEHMGCHRSIFIRFVMDMDMTYMIAYDNNYHHDRNKINKTMNDNE